MTPKPPITAASLPPDWCGVAREALRCGPHSVRACPTAPTIEVRTTDGTIGPLMLPGGGFTFTSFSDRDAVLARIK